MLKKPNESLKRILRGTFSPRADVGFHIMPKQHGSFLSFEGFVEEDEGRDIFIEA